MKRETLILRLAIWGIGIPVLLLCVWVLPRVLGHPANPEYARWLYPVIAGMYASAVPFFIALYQAMSLLRFIDRNEAFSELSVSALKTIKRCAGVIALLYAAVLPFLYLIAEKDDAPGLILLGLVVVFAALVIGVFAAVLQQLLNKAIEIQSENELTV
ncbi:DUF2975 domain-containing protein [Paenibacillus spiritus]|uniref:DUF2975 domain-containing protein n=1 Tax=Paenibacillus spiritus TaxID=2496557 RepID=A0A5J5G9R1_9BACL|nr:DUF2975 domain-containing protein [Paenibacillus spiritus]